MTITESKYKNIFAVRMETEHYTALVVPSEGGKLASFFDKRTKREYLLQNPSETYLHVGLTDEFVKGECSGFDDMFPTLDPVTVDGKEYPDHGEICRVPFTWKIEGETLVLSYLSETFGYAYQKIFSEKEAGGLTIEYAIENRSNRDLNVLWSAHCLLPAERGGELILPFSDGEVVDCVYDTASKGNEARCSYQQALLSFPFEGKRAKKWYFPNRCQKGYVGYQFPQGDRFIMTFDEKNLPYLGIWLDNGTVNGSRCIGLEPCTVGYDTVLNAERHGQKGILKKKERLQFYISLFIEE